MAEWASTEQRRFCVVLPPIECVAARSDTTHEQRVVVLPAVIELVIVNGNQSAVVKRQVSVDLVYGCQYHKGSLS